VTWQHYVDKKKTPQKTKEKEKKEVKEQS